METEAKLSKVAGLICGSQDYSKLKENFITVAAAHSLFTGARHASEALDFDAFLPRYRSFLAYLVREAPYVLPAMLAAVDFWDEEDYEARLYSLFKTSFQEGMRGFSPTYLKETHALLTSLTWFLSDGEMKLQEKAEAQLTHLQGSELLDLIDELRRAAQRPFMLLTHSSYVMGLTNLERKQLQESIVQCLDVLELQALLHTTKGLRS